jgi:hypothetical protein
MVGFSPIGANALVLYPEPFAGLRVSYLTELSHLHRVSNIPHLHLQTQDYCYRTTCHGKHVKTRFSLQDVASTTLFVRMKTIAL